MTSTNEKKPGDFIDFSNFPRCAAGSRQVEINGVMTGFSRLDKCFAAVREKNLTTENVIRAALLEEVRTCNYIPPGVNEAYATALMEEYHKALLMSEDEKTRTG